MIYYILLMVAIIFADQLTKWLAVICLKGEESFPFWENVFHFTYVENTGSAFGMLKDHRWVFMSVSTVVIIVALLIFFIYYKKLTRLMRWAICFLIAGGIGNMIDRVFLGYVVDFLDFTLIDFAVFNVADSFVCIGAGLLLLWYVLDAVNEYKQKKAEKLEASIDAVAQPKTDSEGVNTDAAEAKTDAAAVTENAVSDDASDIEDNAETLGEAVQTPVAEETSTEKNESEPSTEPTEDENTPDVTADEENTESGNKS